MIQFYVRNNILKYFKSSVLALFETTFILTFWFYGATDSNIQIIGLLSQKKKKKEKMEQSQKNQYE